ncbi:DUF3015 domain-containing protein [Litoribacillus peritrichatus]
MKRSLLAAGLLAASFSASAVVPGGDSCGWGNMLFEGQSGLPMHVVASTTNGTSGNASFGMTSGTNGCSANGTLTYGGQPMIDLSSIMDEFSEDVARGHGDALRTVAVALNIEAQDRATFDAVMHENFAVIFPNENVTSDQAMSAVLEVMKADDRLSKYAA